MHISARRGLLALLVALPACSGDAVDALTSATKTIGATGGDLTLPGGLALTIPAGALSGDVAVGAEVVSDLAGAGLEALPDYLSGTPAISVSLTPHGTTFDAPVTLTLPLPAELAADPGNLVAMRLASPDAGEWEPVGPIRFADGEATLQISGFSVYTLVQAGTCPCFNGSNLRSFYAYGEGLVQSDGWRRSLSRHYSTTPSQEEKDRFTAQGRDWRDYFPEELVRDSVQVNYFPPNSGALSNGQIYALAQESSSRSRYQCSSGSRDGYDFVAGFPDTYAGGGSTINKDSGITRPEFLVCKALILAAETGPAAHEIGVVAAGIPAGEQVELAQASATFEITPDDELVFAPTVVAEGEAYAITIATQPASAVCTLDARASGTMGDDNVLVALTCGTPTEVCNGVDDDNDGATDEGFDTDEDGVTTCGPDGVAGTADDDCDDDDVLVYPGATERCNDVDDDCDGSPMAGETTDGDSDGVPDACDAHPAAGCAVFDVAAVLEVDAMTGGLCFLSESSLPSVLATDLDFLTGAFADHGDGTWDIAGVGKSGDILVVAGGCYQDTATGYCTDNSRPLLPADSEADQATYDACADVAAYACDRTD